MAGFSVAVRVPPPPPTELSSPGSACFLQVCGGEGFNHHVAVERRRAALLLLVLLTCVKVDNLLIKSPLSMSPVREVTS